jgi:hypothetical protein
VKKLLHFRWSINLSKLQITTIFQKWSEIVFSKLTLSLSPFELSEIDKLRFVDFIVTICMQKPFGLIPRIT